MVLPFRHSNLTSCYATAPMMNLTPFSCSLFRIARIHPTHARLAVAALALTLVAVATAGTPPRLDASVVAGGGGHSQSDPSHRVRFALEGTVGQSATAPLHGQRFSIVGGFWQSPPSGHAECIFRNGFED